jgi:membrane-bound lytic murein transglycosylase B
MRLARVLRALFCCAGAMAGIATVAHAQSVASSESIESARESFIESMVTQHGFDRRELADVLAGVEIRQSILDAISRPVERVAPWYEYRQIFLTPERIAQGASFWHEHQASIDRAAARFAVDPDILVAILGIETLYGQRMGSYRVLDALATLAFAYPPRAAFFSSELESFFLLSRDEGAGLFAAVGSYAGAMGAGQFIPSSFRAYAVDGDEDGHRDLWEDWDDIFASIANYFHAHGWRNGEIIAERGVMADGAPPPRLGNALELTETVGSLRSAGFEIAATRAGTMPAAAYALESDERNLEHWIVYHNFYVITRYNRSVKYALAAYQLSLAIRAQFDAIREGVQ